VRRGDWMQTYTGRVFWPMDPREDDLCIEDIAHALAHQCRFAGHCAEFYSVAQHSVIVASLLSEPFRLEGLMHDAAEAYLVDLPRPVKPYLDGYAAAELELRTCISDRYHLRMDPVATNVVKRADNIALATEARDLMMWPPPADWHLEELPRHKRIVPIGPSAAEAQFLAWWEDNRNG